MRLLILIKKAVDSNGLANSQLSPKQNKIYRYLKKETNKIIIVIKMITFEHLRHNRMFLDKTQGWCHIIARL